LHHLLVPSQLGWVALGAFLMGFTSLNRVRADPCAGPAWQTFDLTLSPGTRTEIAGPFYYRQQRETEETRAWPPFYSRYTDPVLGSGEINILFPLYSYEYYGDQYRWQFAQMFSHAGGPTPGVAEDARRFTIYAVAEKRRGHGQLLGPVFLGAPW
jgi:hypothetical protein